MKLLSLIYLSKAAPLDPEDLHLILTAARAGNGNRGISGMLLYMPGDAVNNGRFMQVLEGGEAEVRYLFEKIKVDPRHSDVRLLHEEWLDERNFGEWTMGFQSLTPETFHSNTGWFDLNENFLAQQPMQRYNTALNFLQTFYRLRTKP
jgi:hypothetical protein